MRVTILGAGAVGGWLAAGLARAGLDNPGLASSASWPAAPAWRRCGRRASSSSTASGGRPSRSKRPTTPPPWPAPTSCCSG
ncbi:hypothetical protein ACFQY5_19320 [Paeniroseomonas aquatica]|uniref:hypothetical protein n=1 Tax=Paeniroseomonas aquatica TaxID=373043 RepID=UPI0036159915